jgi:hypothetical protein
MRRLRYALRRLGPNRSGAAAIEFAIVSMALILVCLGVIELGRGLQLRNELSFAADFGARKILTDMTISNEALEEEVRAAFRRGEPERLEVSIGAETVDGVDFRTVALSYPFTLLLPGLAGDTIRLGLDRRVPTG